MLLRYIIALHHCATLLRYVIALRYCATLLRYIIALHSLLCHLYLTTIPSIPVGKLRPAVQFELLDVKRCCSPEAMLLSRSDATLQKRCCSPEAMLLSRSDAALQKRCCSPEAMLLSRSDAAL
jgi:hypothetical protein